MTPSIPAIQFEQLSKRFGRIQAVNDLSLAIEPGQMAGFLGPNGAGKSTTLFMIPRLIRPTSGHIRIFGVDIWREFKRAIRSVGVMVETPAFYEYLTGRLNLELTARLLGNVSAGDIDQILKQVGLAGRQHDRVGTYSLGMKQRLGIGRAMLARPRLLVLDEPTNGMDPEGTQELLAFLRSRVHSDGLTIFISSHLMSEIEEFCDTVSVINRGRLVASGRVKDILRPHQRIVRVTFAGDPPPPDSLSRREEIQHAELLAPSTLEITLAHDDPAWLNHYLHQAGFRVASLAPRQKTLKEFFLSITGENRHE